MHFATQESNLCVGNFVLYFSYVLTNLLFWVMFHTSIVFRIFKHYFGSENMTKNSTVMIQQELIKLDDVIEIFPPI